MSLIDPIEREGEYMSGKVCTETGVYECELVYGIVTKQRLLGELIGSFYCSIVQDEIIKLNSALKELFGRNIIDYSAEEIDNLILEYICLKK